jgi:hypothetical protein
MASWGTLLPGNSVVCPIFRSRSFEDSSPWRSFSPSIPVLSWLQQERVGQLLALLQGQPATLAAQDCVPDTPGQQTCPASQVRPPFGHWRWASTGGASWCTTAASTRESATNEREVHMLAPGIKQAACDNGRSGRIPGEGRTDPPNWFGDQARSMPSLILAPQEIGSRPGHAKYNLSLAISQYCSQCCMYYKCYITSAYRYYTADS